MFYDMTGRDHGGMQIPFTALVVPRPIGWISTVDGQGRVRLATLSALSAFAKHADALTDPEAEERFMKSLRVVFKSDEGREAFDRAKIEQSVALATRKRGISQERLDQLVSGIQRQIETLGDSEVQAKLIGEVGLEEFLRRAKTNDY